MIRPAGTPPHFGDLFGATPAARARVVGVDLAGPEARATGWCLLDGSKARSAVLRTDEDILEETVRSRPDLVSIDSPLCLPRGRTSVGDDLLAEQSRSRDRLNRQELGSEINAGGRQRWLSAWTVARVGKAERVVIDGLRFPDDHAFMVERFVDVFSMDDLANCAWEFHRPPFPRVVGHDVQSDYADEDADRGGGSHDA